MVQKTLNCVYEIIISSLYMTLWYVSGLKKKISTKKNWKIVVWFYFVFCPAERLKKKDDTVILYWKINDQVTKSPFSIWHIKWIK